MEKRVILAFVLSFAVLYAFRALYTPSPPASELPQSAPTSAPPPPTSRAVPAQAPPPKGDERSLSVPAGNIQAEKSEEIVFDTPLYVATFSNVGAVLKSFKLKQYPDGEGHPVELINQEAGSKVGWPLALTTGDQAQDEQLRVAQFVAHAESSRLVLEFASNGVHARKAVQFDRENYLFTLEIALTKDGKDLPFEVAWKGSFGDQSIPQDPAKRNAVYQSDAVFKRVALRSLKDQPQNLMSPRAGVEDQYFLAMFMSTDNPLAVKVSKEEYPGSDGKPIPTLVTSCAMPDGNAIRVYVGPKQQDWLTKADPQLAKVLDYGY